VGFGAVSLHDGTTVCGMLERTSNVFTDLECPDANVGTDRNDELGWIVRKHFDGSRHDPGHRAAPASMHCTDVPARGMRDQNRDAIGRPRSSPEAFVARNERVTFQLGNRLSDIEPRDLAHVSPVHLPLLKEAITRKVQAPDKARTVLADRFVVVGQMKTEVERVVWRDAHTTRSCRKRMTETVPIQKGGMQRTHIVVSSTARLHEPLLQAKEAVPKSGLGVG